MQPPPEQRAEGELPFLTLACLGKFPTESKSDPDMEVGSDIRAHSHLQEPPTGLQLCSWMSSASGAGTAHKRCTLTVPGNKAAFNQEKAGF